jgi:hypothetical protein
MVLRAYVQRILDRPSLKQWFERETSCLLKPAA